MKKSLFAMGAVLAMIAIFNVSAEEVADIIQSRVSIYLSENR